METVAKQRALFFLPRFVFVLANQHFRCKRERCVRETIESTFVYASLRFLAPPSPCSSESGAYPASSETGCSWIDNRPEARIGKAISRRSCKGFSLTGPCSGHDNLSLIGFRNSRSLLRFRLACAHVTRGVRAMRRSVS